jgi:hypothetical protein
MRCRPGGDSNLKPRRGPAWRPCQTVSQRAKARPRRPRRQAQGCVRAGPGPPSAGLGAASECPAIIASSGPRARAWPVAGWAQGSWWILFRVRHDAGQLEAAPRRGRPASRRRAPAWARGPVLRVTARRRARRGTRSSVATRRRRRAQPAASARGSDAPRRRPHRRLG